MALVLLAVCLQALGQVCPPNIDFEKGDFTGWSAFNGKAIVSNGQNQITLTPALPGNGRITLIDQRSANFVDPYGRFPMLCPNGSGYSVKLGNSSGGAEAEGLSYEFTIPPNQNEYSLIYHYAVVFQDPHHQPYEQPRMEIQVLNITDYELIQCSSFTFIPVGSGLPGFFQSPYSQNGIPVWCKDWTAVSIKLDNYAGKRIRLSFKTADCTFSAHFGYAYIDVNSECSSNFIGASFCPDDTAINVTAPYGYANYTWFNNNFTAVLGNQQTIRYSPPPPAGTTIAVEMVPYDGYGCKDTLYASLLDNLQVIANAGSDKIDCTPGPFQIGANPKPGLTYSWTPPSGLTNTQIANPVANPSSTTTYVLTTRHDGGGCATTDTVIVRNNIIDTALQFTGKDMYCFASGDSSILRVNPGRSVQWFRNGSALTGANQPFYYVNKTGSYHALITAPDGCIDSTYRKEVTIEVPRPGVEYPVQYAVSQLALPLAARQFGSTANWRPSAGLDNSSSYTPVFTGLNDQLYEIEIRSALGCLTVDRQQIKITPKIEIWVPRAFTPNNDGLNDLLRPTLMGIKELKYFRVFNRWGQMIYETKTPMAGWDGRLQGVLQSGQVVVWVAEGVGLDNKMYLRKGSTVLMR